ncbi:MAG TPA: tetratricopeptide repeat protein, partial [Trueperaceae bacterium]|nr:tetratricopeptide repeat protein [Trueperaceae bacterium]
AYLETYTAPALRARRAGTLSYQSGFELAEQAVTARRTALTVWQHGRMHPNPDTAIQLLRESVQLAEDSGTKYEVARNAGALAARLAQQGEFARAASWARWALDVFDREHLRDGPRRLIIVNDLAHARIMTGDLVGLHSTLEDAQALVEGALPQLAVMLRSTLAQLELAHGDPVAAKELLSATYQASPRRSRARYGFQLVRALLELGRLEEAWQVALDVSETSAAGEGHERSQSALARGMVGAVARAYGSGSGSADGGRNAVPGDSAESDLLEALFDAALPAEQRLTAALYYLLASGGSAHNVPAALVPVLSALHPVALRVLSGPPDVFQGVWATLGGPTVELSLRFLGGVECRWQGRDVSLPARLAEVALALALHPTGISRDELNTFLTPDGQPPFTSGGMRGMMTRLRGQLPVSEAPYRFTVPIRADILEVRQLIAAGKVREAIGLLHGPLLPMSEAPGVVEQRWDLEEELRQAALLVGDADALYDLAERLGDDLEFWQAAADALGVGDPRLALARARVRRLVDAYDERS